jgi:hypothetical protein
VTDTADFALQAIERYAPDIDVPPPAVLDQTRRNIEAQVALLTEFGAVRASGLAEFAGSRAKRPGVTVDNWRRAHRIVTVRYRDETYVPGFLLAEDGQPDPVAQPALAKLAAYGASDWQAALWWIIPASTLDRRRPVDVLLSARDHGDREHVGKDLEAAATRRRDWF